MSWEDLIKQVDWEVKRGEGKYIDCPDHVNYYLDGKKVWEDDFNKPNDVQIYNCMLECFKNNAFALGGKCYNEWWEEEQK